MEPAGLGKIVSDGNGSYRACSAPEKVNSLRKIGRGSRGRSGQGLSAGADEPSLYEFEENFNIKRTWSAGASRYAETASTIESGAEVGIMRLRRQPAAVSKGLNWESVRSWPLGKSSI